MLLKQTLILCNKSNKVEFNEFSWLSVVLKDIQHEIQYLVCSVLEQNNKGEMDTEKSKNCSKEIATLHL